MHEMGIANSILEAVRTEAARYPGSRPTKVGVRIGTLAAIDKDALEFCFGALIKDSDLEQLALEVEVCERRHRCRLCSREFVVREYDFQCPGCGGLDSECIAGDELELAYVEVEEDEPSAVGTQSSERE